LSAITRNTTSFPRSRRTASPPSSASTSS
jgi:hypothetical protein